MLLLTIVGIEYGGWFMLTIVRGRQQMTDFQKAFARAGHAHAGVLVTLALVGLILADAADMSGLHETVARNGIWLAAILMPAGFFFSSMGRGATQPNRLIWPRLRRHGVPRRRRRRPRHRAHCHLSVGDWRLAVGERRNS